MRSILLFTFAILFSSCTCFAQKPVGSVTLGYEYLNAEAPTGARNSLQGWHGTLAFNLNKHYSLFADSGNFYAAPENVHSITGGLQWKIMKLGRLTPNIFGEIGEARTSKPMKIAYSPEYVLGGGFILKVNKHLSLDLTPAEYVITTSNGSALNNYTAALGLIFPFGHKH